MNRIESAVIVFSLLPLIMAVIFNLAVMPRRKSNMISSLKSAEFPSEGSFEKVIGAAETNRYIQSGIDRVSRDFDSLYSTRLIFPAFLLSFFYLIGLSLGISALKINCKTFLCQPFSCFNPNLLHNPTFAILGSYVFNTGVVVRRSFMADVTKNVFWASINRVVFSVGFSIAIAAFPIVHTQWEAILCFTISFFPKLFITLIRKQATKRLSLTDTAVQELDLQLVQGIDVWKEERLEEEGIESIQNLATADVLGLAVKTHYPVRTIVDWIDQAILIQRFPGFFKALQGAGLPVSAIEFAWMGSQLEKNKPLTVIMASKTQIELVVLEQAMSSFYEDSAVRILWRLWQSRNSDE